MIVVYAKVTKNRNFSFVLNNVLMDKSVAYDRHVITTLSCAPKKGWSPKKGGRGLPFAHWEQDCLSIG